MTRASPRARAAAVLAALVAAWWLAALLPAAAVRAFDVSDPAQQLAVARRSAEFMRTAGPLAWAGAVAGGSLAKPGQNAALSLLLLAGVPADSLGYHFATALFVSLSLGALAAAAALALGLEAAALLAVLCAGSSAVLAEAYHGGHTWYGQAFLWLALLAEAARGEGRGRARAELGQGLLLGLSALSSHHMAPFCVFLAARRLLVLRRAGARAPRLAGAAAAMLAGALAPIVLLETAGAGLSRPSYLYLLLSMLQVATQTTRPEYANLHGFLWRWLFGVDGPVPGLAVAALAVLGAAALWRGRGRERSGLELFAAFAGAMLLFYELPQALRIGRVHLPLLLLVFACAAAGAAAAAQRLRPRQRRPALAVLGAALFLSGLSRRAELFQAFHAGPAVTAAAGPGKLLVAGISVPFSYADAERAVSCAALAAAAKTGEEPVLVSRWSAWFWRGFLKPDRFDVPVERLYASAAPHVDVPGVESTSYQLYSNDAFYWRVKTGQLPFPVPNRLYRAADVLAACRGRF